MILQMKLKNTIVKDLQDMQINEHYSKLVSDMDTILDNEINLINSQVEILNIKEGSGINAPFLITFLGNLRHLDFVHNQWQF